MEEVDMAVDEWGEMGQLEKGEVRCGREMDTQPAGWTNAGSTRYYKVSPSPSPFQEDRRSFGTSKIMISLAIFLLLWQQGIFTCARPMIQTRQVVGVPQFVLDYGML